MIARHVVTRRLLPTLVIVLAVLAFTGCPGMFAISPGGTFTVECYSYGDMSQAQVVVVFDQDDDIDVVTEYTYRFPVDQYENTSGDVLVTQSFECTDVPVGDYFVYAFLDFDGDSVYEPIPFEDDSWTYGEPNYYIDDSSHPYLIGGKYDPPLIPNYSVSSTYAAPLEFTLYYGSPPS
jgi:hypothetical protein